MSPKEVPFDVPGNLNDRAMLLRTAITKKEFLSCFLGCALLSEPVRKMGCAPLDQDDKSLDLSLYPVDFQGEIIYAPPFPPDLGQKAFSRERGGGGVYISNPPPPPPRQEFYTPPLLLSASHPQSVFSWVGGWGCIKFGPVDFQYCLLEFVFRAKFKPTPPPPQPISGHEAFFMRGGGLPVYRVFGWNRNHHFTILV